MHQRDDLDDVIQAAADLLRAASHAVALSGAGISAESGIPTFRGAGGLWTRFGEPTFDGWDQFNEDPAAWWRSVIAHRDQSSEFNDALDRAKPNAAHHALADLERMGRLAHVITQNVDNLHRQAGSRRLMYHG